MRLSRARAVCYKAGVDQAVILLVEDEARIADVVEYALQERGYRVCRAAEGVRALAAFEERKPDLVLLDLKLPGISGWDLFDEFRARRPAVPIIMLTSLAEESDRVSGLEKGADDYVTKPFSPRELTARVRAVLRRAALAQSDPQRAVLRAGRLVLEPEGLRSAYDGREIGLTVFEFRLVEALARHPARVFTRDQLISAVYGSDAFVTDRNVDSLVKRVRRRFEDAGAGNPVRTVYRMGYRLSPELDDSE
jgi:DNA-binding response OmpR family regulator